MNATDPAYNLTVLADRLRAGEAKHVLPVLEHERLSASILRPVQGEPFEEEPASSDTIYVVIAGNASFSCGHGSDMEATAGDVLFVPAGEDRHFSNTSRKFRVWRLSLRGGD